MLCRLNPDKNYSSLSRYKSRSKYTALSGHEKFFPSSSKNMIKIYCKYIQYIKYIFNILQIQYMNCIEFIEDCKKTNLNFANYLCHNFHFLLSQIAGTWLFYESFLYRCCQRFLVYTIKYSHIYVYINLNKNSLTYKIPQNFSFTF